MDVLPYRTNSIIRFPKRCHNNKTVIKIILTLYDCGKSCQTLILDLKKTTYIDFNIFIFLKLCIDELFVKHNTEVLFLNETGLFSDYSNLLPLVLNNNKRLPQENYFYFNYYTKNDESIFTMDLKKTLQKIKDNDIRSNLQLIISELFINAAKHSQYNNNNNIDNLIYYGILINKKMIKFSIANTGNSFSEQIIRKYNINYEEEHSYIRKAFDLGFSTKTEDTGGLGLPAIEKIVKNCCATIQIISGKGLFHNEYIKQTIMDNSIIISKLDDSEDLIKPSPGTIVYLEFDILNFDKNYQLVEKTENLLDKLTLEA